MLGYIKALVMDLATHNGKETKTEMGKHDECHKSRKTLSEDLVVSSASSRASPRLEGCMKDLEVIWDEFG